MFMCKMPAPCPKFTRPNLPKRTSTRCFYVGGVVFKTSQGASFRMDFRFANIFGLHIGNLPNFNLKLWPRLYILVFFVLSRLSTFFRFDVVPKVSCHGLEQRDARFMWPIVIN